MKNKLLFVVNTADFFISHRLQIGLEAIKKGHEVHIATDLSNFEKKLKNLNFNVHHLNINRSSQGLISNFEIFVKIFRIFIKLKPQIVHLVTIKPVIFGGIVARLLGVSSIVFAISGLGYIFIADGFFAKLRKLVVSKAYSLALNHKNMAIIVQNKEDKKYISNLNKSFSKNIYLIHGSGVDFNYFQSLPFPSGIPIICLASRLLFDKGIQEFVETAEKLKKIGLKARFVLVGKIDESNPSRIPQSLIEEWVSKNIIEWWGYKSNMKQVFSKATIVVLPSYREGLPKVLVEAAACGRPIITTDVPGCRDTVINKKTGVLIPVRNSMALSEAILKLINNPFIYKSMGKEGRKYSKKKFDLGKTVNEHIEIYDKLLIRAKK